MPPKTSLFFTYKSDEPWECRLQCTQCTGTRRDGGRCTRRTCIGLRYCYAHLALERHLEIRNSGIAEAGKGLYAFDRNAEDDAIVFRNGDVIIEYDGEEISKDELEERYGRNTAPYGIQLRKSGSTG
ncbi:uncharacterized protein BJ171DRAFT_608374 [Polychytrium aggregatum]|uniref:uncharacterized protein n=1 Tax=Polychytrium aggregatum TaxID=110093 RepID=UPI0022FE67F3|nr:uncharacterized protein BJ171DRAFT_608374 [Polychytrium aggregatum]KAI9183756.1 hypothetical protein BJ171DRAFT_608374 [Polychytrium aggregatum]